MSGDFVLRIDGFAALVLSEGEFIERVGGHKGSICVLQLDRDDGGGHSHVVDVSVCRDGVMDEEQLQIPSSYTGLFLFSMTFSLPIIVVSSSQPWHNF